MTQAQFEVRKNGSDNGALIASRTEEGFRVYSLQNPSNVYLVKQEGEQWTCTCPDFEAHKSDTTWRCKYVLAVAPWPNGEHAQAPQPDYGNANEPTIPLQPPQEPPVVKRRTTQRPERLGSYVDQTER